jgi:phosphomevalonate kinase
MTLVATAPGKLILTGEYAVLDGASALVVAVDRRAVARMRGPAPVGSSPFLLSVAQEIAARRGADDPAAKAALEISVDSSAFYAGAQKLGLGSSAAVTVAATALALSHADGAGSPDEVFAIASAAHAAAQGTRGARGSGADIAAATYGGVIRFSGGKPFPAKQWPRGVTLVPFFTGESADTASLVARVLAARAERPAAVNAALTAIADASTAAIGAVFAGHPAGIVGGLALAAAAIDRLALATGIALVPDCVIAARSALKAFGGTAKTTGAGGGDVAIAVVPETEDPGAVHRTLVACGCQPLSLSVDDGGVDLRSPAS